MNSAFLDTSVLAEALLQASDLAKIAKIEIERYDLTEVPVYAFKELKAGPLSNYVWFHNRLVQLNSFSKAMKALHQMALTPRRYTTATALEALANASTASAKHSLGSLVSKYGGTANFDAVQRDQYRLHLKKVIFKAWKNRRNIASVTTNELTCYDEVAPFEKNGWIELEPKKCSLDNSECCLAKILRSKSSDLTKIKDALENNLTKPERNRQHKEVRNILRKPKDRVMDANCRNLGDVILAILSPKDSIILTKNVDDFNVIAGAIGKRVQKL